MGKSIKDLSSINAIETNDKILVDRNGKGYSANLLETLKEIIKNTTNRIDGGVINGENTPTINGIGEITENNEILINEEMLSTGTYTLKYLDGNDNVVDNSKPITTFTI
jgi:hypothetical protein